MGIYFPGIHHINLRWLYEAYLRTRPDGVATGVGGRTNGYNYGLFGEAGDNLRALLERGQVRHLPMPPVRRVHIPKGTGGDTRPIGIPTFEDKVLQRAVVMVFCGNKPCL